MSNINRKISIVSELYTLKFLLDDPDPVRKYHSAFENILLDLPINHVLGEISKSHTMALKSKDILINKGFSIYDGLWCDSPHNSENDNEYYGNNNPADILIIDKLTQKQFGFSIKSYTQRRALNIREVSLKTLGDTSEDLFEQDKVVIPNIVDIVMCEKKSHMTEKLFKELLDAPYLVRLFFPPSELEYTNIICYGDYHNYTVLEHKPQLNFNNIDNFSLVRNVLRFSVESNDYRVYFRKRGNCWMAQLVTDLEGI